MMSLPARSTAAVVALAVLLAACTSKPRKAVVKEVTLRVGLLYTTGGQGGDLASAVLGAAKLATDAAARRKVKVEIEEADYAGDPAKVEAALNGLRSKVDAIVVGTDDDAVLPAVAAVTEVPVLYAFITRDGVVSDSQNAFRVAPPNILQAQKMVDFLVGHRKYKRISLIADDTPFGEEGRRDLNEAFGASGTTPIQEAIFTPGGDIHTPIAHAAQQSAEAVVLWVASPGEAARIVVEAQRIGFAPQIVLSGNLATTTFAKNASAQVTPVAFRDGMLSVGPWAGPWFNLPRILDFYSDFKTENSALAPVQAAAAYDAIASLVAVARAGSSADSRRLRSGLQTLRDFEGVGVPVTFGRDKHEGIDIDDLAIYGYTKDQDAAGGDFAPDVNTGGGFFTIVYESLNLPPRYAFLAAHS